MSLLFFDLETIPGEEKPSRDEVKVPANYKKEEAIKKYIDENLDNEYRKQALKSHKGRIFCLGYKYEDEDKPTVLHGTEKDIITNFQDVVTRDYGHEYAVNFVGHNIKEFDIPWIYHRACKYNCDKLKRIFSMVKRPNYGEIFIDTIDKWAYSSRNMVSMDDICKFFGIEGKGDMDGSKVWDEVLAGNHQKVYDYCGDDVLNVEKIYNLLT